MNFATLIYDNFLEAINLASFLSDNNGAKQKISPIIPPSHFIKQHTILKYKKKHNANILVETGTYLGTMIEAQKHYFSKIYSIELDEKLYKNATKRFMSYSHIDIVHGDSSQELQNVAKKTMDLYCTSYCSRNSPRSTRSVKYY